MTGFSFDDHGAQMGDWLSPSSSPGSLFASVMNDDVNPRPDNAYTNGNQPGFSFPEILENSVPPLANQKEASRGGLMDRMAARAGFNAPRLDTESIRPVGLSKGHDAESSYLTIPAGYSPASLLDDSPVFVTNSMAQSSPTTGKFGFLQSGGGQSAPMAEFSQNGNDNFFENLNPDFAFKPFPGSGPSSQFNVSNGAPVNGFPQQSYTNFFENQDTFPNYGMEPPRNTVVNQQQVIPGDSDHSPPLDELLEEDADPRGSADHAITGDQGEDGYNWRKYGQKQVKGSNFPRSYYRCTHSNCLVKKKVERGQEGHVTEIIYKGAHTHPKPPPNRRVTAGSSSALLENGEIIGGTCADGDLVWRDVPNGNGALDWMHENLEITSSVITNSLQAQNGGKLELGEALNGTSTFSNGEHDEDRVTQGSLSLGYEGDGDESQSKRRKTELAASEVSGATRAIREPRVVVQTTSEVDILDDGYRWRKYGQKVVKGNPNPRSYYKCTSAGCSVRKHVERASHDLKSVITTYEGKHNHDVPASRNNSHISAVLAGNLPSQLVRPEPAQLHNNSMAQYDRASLGPYGIQGRPPMGTSSGHSFGFGMRQPGLSMPEMRPMNPYLAEQNQVMNGMGRILKPEQMSEGSNGSSAYNQAINRFPQGPQM